jgi:hypothetical protein
MNDYGGISPTPPPDPDQARWLANVIRTVQLPGAALQWYGVVSMLLAAIVVAIFLAVPDEVSHRVYDQMVKSQRDKPAHERTPLPPFDQFARTQQIEWLAGGGLSLVCSFLIALGGIKMKQLHGYGWAVAGSVLAAIPCTNSCCCIGLPVGLYALVTLFGSDVRLGFARVGAAGGLDAFRSEFQARDDDPPSRPIRLE